MEGKVKNLRAIKCFRICLKGTLGKENTFERYCRTELAGDEACRNWNVGRKHSGVVGQFLKLRNTHRTGVDLLPVAHKIFVLGPFSFYFLPFNHTQYVNYFKSPVSTVPQKLKTVIKMTMEIFQHTCKCSSL